MRSALLAALVVLAPVAGQARSVYGDKAPPAGDTTYDDTRTVIGTSSATSGWATIYPHQQKLFYAVGRWWFFYSPGGSDNVYRTSTDGVTWSGTSVVRATSTQFGHRSAYCFDGTYIHYAYGLNTLGEDIFYRRGLLNSNGTITWSAAEQTAYATGGTKTTAYMSIIVDSTGAPWIGFAEFSGFEYTYPATTKVIKSSATDGTWATEAGFPEDLSTNSDVYPYPFGAALTEGKTYWVWSRHQYNGNTKLGGRLWNGSAWEAAEDASSLDGGSNWISLAADGDIVHLAYLEETPSFKYRRRAANGTWASEVTLEGTVSGFNQMPVLLRLDTDDLQACWVTATTHLVTCRHIVDGAMADDAEVLQDESTPTLVTQHPLHLALDSGTGDFMLGYVTDASSPYDVVTILRDATVSSGAQPFGSVFADVSQR